MTFATTHDLSDREYRALAEFRYRIRKFLRFSEVAAREAGLEPHQHQLLLALRGLPAETQPTIGHLAERLQIRHHSAVELLDRLAERGLIWRRRSKDDRREVLVHLTPRGVRVLRELSLGHRAELGVAAPALAKALRAMVRRAAAAPALWPAVFALEGAGLWR